MSERSTRYEKCRKIKGSAEKRVRDRGDQNPERVQIQLDATLFPGSVPAISVGTRLGDVTGVVGYSFGNYEVNATELFKTTGTNLQPEKTFLNGTPSKVTVASYNVLNLSPDPSDDNQRATLADQIVNNLRSPDVIALQEIQDNSGETDDGTTDATQTLQKLVDAIAAAGGPSYGFLIRGTSDVGILRRLEPPHPNGPLLDG